MPVYFYTNLENNKVYVGQTINMRERHLSHIRDARNKRVKNSSFHRAIERYGMDRFHLQEIHPSTDKPELDNLEKIWIILLQSTNNKYGYNLTSGGDGTKGYHPTKDAIARTAKANLGNKYSLGYKHTPEAKEKISSALKLRIPKPISEKTRTLLSLSHLNKTQSKETKLKRSLSLKGRPWSEKRRVAHENQKIK